MEPTLPKHSFTVLPKDKQTRILDAALDEFSSNHYHEASINQIIQTADISRGSFYQYFEDKEDLYFFMISEIIHDTAARFINQNLQHPSLNIFEVYKGLLVYTLDLISDIKYGSFFKNLILGMSSEFQLKYKLILNRVVDDILHNQIDSRIKDSRYDEATLRELINVLGLINRDLLELKITNKLDDEAILRIYELRMQLINKP